MAQFHCENSIFCLGDIVNLILLNGGIKIFHSLTTVNKSLKELCESFLDSPICKKETKSCIGSIYFSHFPGTPRGKFSCSSLIDFPFEIITRYTDGNSPIHFMHGDQIDGVLVPIDGKVKLCMISRFGSLSRIYCYSIEEYLDVVDFLMSVFLYEMTKVSQNGINNNSTVAKIKRNYIKYDFRKKNLSITELLYHQELYKILKY